MKTPVFWTPHRRDANPAVEPPLALAIGRAIWDNSPILLAIDVVMAFALLPGLFAAGFGGMIVAPIAIVTLAGPIWIASLAASEAILDGEIVGLRRFGGMIRASAQPGIRIAILPGLIASVLLGTLALAGGNGDRRWMLAPVVVDGLVLSLIVIAGLAVSWLAARGRQVDRQLWREGAIVAGAAPQAIGGIVAVAVLIGIASQLIGPLMIGILFAPFAVFVAATVRWIVATRGINVDA